MEVETATSIHANATTCADEAIISLSKAEASTATACTEEDIKFVRKTVTPMDHAAVKSEDSCVMSYRDSTHGKTVGRDKVDDSECGNADIIYSQDLVARDMDIPSNVNATANNGVLNFKRFRKAIAVHFYSYQ